MVAPATGFPFLSVLAFWTDADFGAVGAAFLSSASADSDDAVKTDSNETTSIKRVDFVMTNTPLTLATANTCSRHSPSCPPSSELPNEFQ
jgi:hypothetical protein